MQGMDPAFVVRLPGGRGYPVYAGAPVPAAVAATWRPEWRQAFVVADTNTYPLFVPALVDALAGVCPLVRALSFSAGEAHKTRATKEALEDAMLAAGVDRSACVVAVGGGVVLDVAGFVAATCLRGVTWVSVATTLLAQVDAAIGGKTGVNTPAGKNLIGAIHQPSAVFLHTEALETLPASEWRNGMAEAVKHAVLSGEDLLVEVERLSANGMPTSIPAGLIARLAAVKARVVEADETEQGLRATLNYGHTVGHAIERAMDFEVPHGAAVSIGMVVEGRVATRLAGFPEPALGRLRALLSSLGLPVRPPVAFEDAARFFAMDKKRRDGETRLSLPRALGVMEPAGGRYTVPVSDEVLAWAWEDA